MTPMMIGHKRLQGLDGFPYIALIHRLLISPEIDIGRPAADFNGFGARINFYRTVGGAPLSL